MNDQTPISANDADFSWITRHQDIAALGVVAMSGTPADPIDAMVEQFQRLNDDHQQAVLKAAEHLLEGQRVVAGDTPIMALYRRQRALHDAASVYYLGNQPNVDDTLERLFFSEAGKIDREILAQPITCLADLAVKVLVDSHDGDFGLEEPLIEECRSLIPVVA